MATLIKNGKIVPSSSLPDLVLGPADDPAAIAGALEGARVVAVSFPKFGDGRGFSIGRLLRERYGYKGELRAVGEGVARDHLYSLAQCGFEPTYELSGGAADANVFNDRGLEVVNLANGMIDIHTPAERIAVADLDAMVDVTLALVEAARA